jgi:guanylate kinase
MQKEDFIIWARKLQGSYNASEEVRARLSYVDLLAIVGPTGVGKTTIINELNIPAVMSDVTRNMRPDEKNNLNYHFREDYLGILQEIKTGQFAQFVVSDAGDFYGTHVDAYPEKDWCSMAIFADAIPSF